MILFRFIRFFILLLIGTLAFISSHAQITCNFTSALDSGCAPLAVVLSDASVSPSSPITSRTWTITGPSGNLPVGNGNNYVYIYNECGNYTVSLTVTNAAGQTCTKTVIGAVKIFCKPTANFTYSPKVGCPPTTVTFQNVSLPGSGVIDSFICDCRNGSTPRFGRGVTSFTCNYLLPGTYIPTCYVINSKGCTDDSTFIFDTIRIKPEPKITSLTASKTTSCTTPVNISFTSTVANGLTPNYQWFYRQNPSTTWIPFGSNSSTANNNFTTGTYDIKLSIIDPVSLCTKDSVIQAYISIGNNPSPAFSVSSPKICAGSTTNFTYTGAGSIASYKWSFAGGLPQTGTTSTVNNVKYDVAGVYPVKLVVTFSNGCMDSIFTQNVVSVGNPVSFTINYVDTDFCKVPDTTCLSYNGPACPGCTYTWGTTIGQYQAIPPINQANICYKVTAYGNSNSFSLTVRDSFGCPSTVITPTVFKAAPLSVNFTKAYQSSCVPGAVDFTNTTVSRSTFTSILWGFAGGTPSSSTASTPPTVTYSAPGCYKDSLVLVTSSGCTGKKIDSVCFGTPVNVTSISISKPSICYEAEDICFTICGPAALDTFIVYPESPVDTTIKVLLYDTANTGCVSYCYKYKNPGVFKPQVIASNKGCRGIPFTGGPGDTVHVFPPASKFIDSSDCSNKFRVLYKNFTAEADSFFWEFPGGLPSSLSTTDSSIIPAVIYPQCGSYQVTLTSFNFSSGCYHPYTKSINISCAGATLTYPDSTGCIPMAAKPVLAISSGSPLPTAIVCDKDNADGLYNSTGPGIIGINTFNYTVPGTFLPCCRLTYPGGCKESVCLSKPIRVSSISAGFAAPDTAGCAPYTTCFTDTSKTVNSILSTCNWDFSDGTPQSFSCGTVCHTFQNSGNYVVKLTRTNADGCVAIATAPIFVNAVNADFLLPDTFTCSSAKDSLLFLNTTTGIGTINYQWITPGNNVGVSSTTVNYFGQYNSVGTANVTLVASDINNFCRDSITKTVTIKDPIANYGVNQIFASCPPLVANFTDSSLNDVSEYHWDFGDGTTSDIQNPSHIFQKAGHFKVWLKVTSNNGCVDSISKDVIVIDGPYGSLTYSPPVKGGCPCTNVTYHLELVNTKNLTFIPSCDTPRYVNNITPLGTDSNPSIFDFTVTYCKTDSCLAQMIVEDGRGQPCRVFYDNVLPPFIIDSPIVDFSYPVSLLCDTGTICFTNLSKNPNSTVQTDSVLWDFGDGAVSKQYSPCHKYLTAGNYTVALTVWNDLGCASTVRKKVVVRKSPTAAFTENDSTGCLSKDARFWDLSKADTNTYIQSWLWTLSSPVPAPNVFVTQNVTKTVGIGTFTVTLLVTDTFGCVDTAMKTLVSRNPPLAKAGVDKTICLGDTTTITGAGGVSYLWSPNYNMQSPSTVSTKVWPRVDTSYIVFVTDAFNCSAYDTMSIKISSVTANFFADSVCFNAPTHFIDTSSNIHANYASSVWNFNDPPANGVGKNTTHTFTTTGNFNVTLTSTNSIGCKDDTTKTVSVVAIPIANFGANPVCFGKATSFIDSSIAGFGNITKWVWLFGDNTADSVNQNPSHTYTSPGNYNVQLTVYNNFGCSNTFQKTTTVHALPQGNFNVDSVCLGTTSHFTNTSTPGSSNIASFIWDFNYPGSTDTVSNVSPTTFIYPTSGLHAVNLSVTDINGCMVSLSKNTQIYNLPTAAFTVSNPCKGQNTVFTNNSIAGDNPLTGYFWTPFNSTSTNQSIAFPNSTSITVDLIATDAKGCKDTTSKLVTIFDRPVAKILPTDSIVCENEPLVLTDTSLRGISAPIMSYQWDMQPDNVVDYTTKNVTHSYGNGGDYFVVHIVVDTNGCSDTTTKKIHVNKNPVASFTNQPTCIGKVSTFVSNSKAGDAPLSSLSYTWNFVNSPPNGTGISVSHTFSAGGNFDVSLSITDANGCSDILTKTIFVNVPPVINVNPSDTTICLGQSANFSINGVFDKVKWSPSTWVNLPDSPNVTITPLNNIKYLVTVYNGNCAPAYDTVSIGVIQRVPIDLEATPNQILLGLNSNLLATYSGIIDSIVWSPDSTLSCRKCKNPVASPQQTTTYKATIYYGKNGITCMNEAEITITVLTTCNGDIVYIPNTFTPNYDGHNDIFRIRGNGVTKINHFRIFDRWGNRVFEALNMSPNADLSGWNGKLDNVGAELNPGVFVYDYEVECINGQKFSGKGNVTLTR